MYLTREEYRVWKMHVDRICDKWDTGTLANHTTKVVDIGYKIVNIWKVNRLNNK